MLAYNPCHQLSRASDGHLVEPWDLAPGMYTITAQTATPCTSNGVSVTVNPNPMVIITHTHHLYAKEKVLW